MGATRMFIRLWILNILFAAKEARFAAGEENTSTIPGKKSTFFSTMLFD
jgi:hypothetical protein